MAARVAGIVCLLGTGVVRIAFAHSAVGQAVIDGQLHGRSGLKGFAAGFLETAKELAGVQVTPAVVTFAKQTRGLLNTTIENILNESASDEEMLDHLIASFTTAKTTLEGKHAIAGTKTTDIETLRQAHIACRQNESAAYSTHGACHQQEQALNVSEQAAQAAFQTSANTASCSGFKNTQRTTEALWDATAVEFVTYLDKLETLRNATELLFEKITECDGLFSELESSRAECDTKQHSFEAALCNYASYIGDACTTYNGSYQTHLDDFNVAHAAVELRVADRKVEFEGLKMADCFLEAIIDVGISNASNIAGLDACKAKNVDTTHLDLKPYTIPPRVACLTPPSLPCSDSFKQQEYGALPAHTQAAECNACTR